MDTNKSLLTIDQETLDWALTPERLEQYLAERQANCFSRYDGQKCPVYGLARNTLGEDIYRVEEEMVRLYTKDGPAFELPGPMKEFIYRFDRMEAHSVWVEGERALDLIRSMRAEESEE